MKKSFIGLLVLLFFSTPAYSAIPIDFIYINGSNNNTEKAHDHFIKEVNNFHPELKKRFAKAIIKGYTEGYNLQYGDKK